MGSEVKLHYKDFFLYIFIILLAVVGVVFLFSKNSSDTDNLSNTDVTVATSSAAPNVKAPAK